VAQPQASDAGFRIVSVPAPLNYRQPEGATAPLRVAVAAALDRTAAAEPIFVIEALGESGVEAAPLGLIESLKDLRRTHDLVFVDQRGAYGTTLVCPPPAGRPGLPSEAIGLFAPERVDACRQAFAGRADLADLNSRTFAADVETTRRALGYGRIELIGYFYGTRIVEDYLRRWPARVTAAVLADPSPVDYPAAEALGPAGAAAIRSTLAACRQERACHERYPDLDADWVRVAAQLPGETAGNGLLSWLMSRTLRWRTAIDWPSDVRALASGPAPAVRARYLAYRRAVLAGYPLGLRLAVDCAENMPRGRAARAAALDPAGDLKAELAACRTWPGRRPPAAFFKPVRAATPVLAMTGAFDVEAPLDATRRSLAGFAHARLVVFPDRARATDFDWEDCAGPLVTAFLESRGRAPVDAACASRLRRPAFAAP